MAEILLPKLIEIPLLELENVDEIELAASLPARAYVRADVFRSQHVVDAVFSPDGLSVVYQLSQTVSISAGDARQRSSLWHLHLADASATRLTAIERDATSVSYCSDGRSILFLSDSAEAPEKQIYRLNFDGTALQQITFLRYGVASYCLSLQSDLVAFAARDPGFIGRRLDDNVRISRSIYRSNAIGYFQEMAQAIYVVHAAGGKPKALTPHDGIVRELVWSPDGDAIASAWYGKANHTTVHGDLCIVDLAGHATKLIEGMNATKLFWTHSGDAIGFVAYPGGDFSRQAQLFLVDRSGGSLRSRTSSLDLPVGGSVLVHSPAATGKIRLRVSPDGLSVVAPVTNGGATHLYEIDLFGAEACKPVVAGARTCYVSDRCGSVVLFSSQDFTTPSELWIADLDTGMERRLTQNNTDWCSRIAWPQIERLRVTPAGGREIEGWIFIPAGMSGPVKTLLFIHGGPHRTYGYTFNEDFLEMVGAGYAVAFANPRGSAGYGDDFARAIFGCWGPAETEDFTAFLDELIRRGLSDPDRLGVTGVSGGGRLSAWLICHTDRFRAAVPEQGNYSNLSMYGVSDIGVEFIGGEMGGAPHEHFQAYWNLSPIAHAHRCTTPALLIHGENDLRCPMEQAEQLYTVLKQNGCEVEMLRLANCSHGLQVAGPPSLRIARMDAMIEWFARYIC